MSFKEVKVTAIKWALMTDEETEIHDFIALVEHHELGIPEKIYSMMKNRVEELSFQRKPKILRDLLRPTPGLKEMTIHLAGLPPETEAIRIECIAEVDESEKTTLITKEEAIAKYGEDAVFTYRNGDWEWEDQEGLVHLMRDGIELTKGLKAKWVDSYDNGDWEWEDMEEGLVHLIRDGIELTKGLKVKWVCSYDNGDWKWRDMEEGLVHLMRDGKELTKGLKAKWVDSYSNGDWKWRDMEEGLVHLMRDGIELTKGLKAKWVDSYDNGDWAWKDQDWNLHEVKGGTK